MVTALSALAALLTVPPVATPAYAQDDNRPSEFGTYNMQGSNRGARWTEEVAPRAGRGVLLALQEVGPGPPRPAPGTANNYQRIQIARTPNNLPNHYSITRWQVGQGIRYVYYLQTDPQRSRILRRDRWRGGRVNLAIVTDTPADEVRVLENPLYRRTGRGNAYRYRPLFGVRYGNTWYWDIHARNNDVPRLIQRVRAFAARHPEAPNWALIGDYNRDIHNLDAEEARTRLTMEDGERLLRTTYPTHISGDRRTELDFAITRGLPDNLQATIPNGGGADHVPLRFARAGAPDLPLMPTRLRTIQVRGQHHQGIRRTRFGAYQMGRAAHRFLFRNTRGGAHRLAFLGGGSGGARTARGDEDICPAIRLDAKPDRPGVIEDGPCGNTRAQWTLTDVGTGVDMELKESNGGAQRWRNVALPTLCLARLGPHVIAEPCAEKDTDQYWWDDAVALSGDWPDAAKDIRLESARYGLRAARGSHESESPVTPAPKPRHGKSDTSRASWNIEQVSPDDNLVRFTDPFNGSLCLGADETLDGPYKFAAVRGCDSGSDADGARQRWLGERYEDGTIRYRNEANNLCLTAHTDQDRPLKLLPCNDTEEQSWKITDPDTKPGLKKRDLRVMPLGDSITFGKQSSDGNGYRDELYDVLEQETGEGQNRVDFVGNVHNGTMADRDNEGHPGKRIDQIAKYAACSVPRYQPNVITLHAGTNDFNQEHDLATAHLRMKDLIERVLNESPKAVVVVAKVIPTGKPGLQPYIDAFNAKLPGVVSELRAAGKHVVLTDTSDVKVSDGLEHDAHPNDNGYAKIGYDFNRGILDAAAKGWIEKPAPQKPDAGCDPDKSKAGPGWRALGAIAPGMSYPAGSTDLADFDGDGRDDYVRIGGDRKVRIALNRKGKPGKPRWEEVNPGTRLTGGRDNWVIRIADIDGNGRADFLLVPPRSSSEDPMHVFLNRGLKNGKFSWDGTHVLDNPAGFGVRQEAIRFADVTGDGRDDFLQVGKNGSIHAYYNRPTHPNGRWSWEKHRYWAPGVFYGSRDMLRLADVSGDGKADYLMVGKHGAVHAYLNNGDKTPHRFTEHRYFVNETDYPGDKVAFRDISGDGKADYTVVYGGGSVRAWLNLGGNT
ncbi:FG-GAP-like repeat-containing protein [Streptomyces sp. BBFR2]|uniref:FG-GAP-like repeat-containing protein n=1 Tax=Streptomyces sp. BBFR2 TaxID=3372854 RepID=UPI0037D9C45D